MGLSSAEKKFLVVTGPPGVGKTTLGDRLAAEAGYTHVDFDKIAVEMSAKLLGGSISKDELMAALSELEKIKPEVRLEQLTADLLSESVSKKENAIMGIVFASTFLTGLLRGFIEYDDENKNTVLSSAIFSANMHTRKRALEILRNLGIKEPALVFLDAPLNVLEEVVARRPTDDVSLASGGLNDPRIVRLFFARSHPYLESEGWPKVIKLRREAVRDMVKIRKILRLLS